MIRVKSVAGLLFVASLLAACGSSGESDSAPEASSAETTVVASDSSVAQEVTTTAESTTTTAAESPEDSTTTAAAPVDSDGDAFVALERFLTQYDLLGQRVIEMSGQFGAAAAGAPADWDPGLLESSFSLGGEVYGLADLIPAGLDASVEQAAVNAAFTLGQAAGAFVYAPGVSPAEWADWAGFMAAGQAQLPTMSAVVTDAASAAPQFVPAAPGSRDEAAQSAIRLAMVRTFGHGGPGLEVDPVVPALSWTGSLPVDVDMGGGYSCAFDPATGAEVVPSGDFVDGVGGCALVFYDGAADIHGPEVEAWLAGNGPRPDGEPVAIVWTGAAWDIIGSAE